VYCIVTKQTKERILDSAEILFAKKGFAATSLRAISFEAGCNIASVNYHFGTKADLFLTVYNRKILPLNQQYQKKLSNLEDEAVDEPIQLEKVLHIIINPILRMREELGEAGDCFISLVAQAYMATDERFRGNLHGLTMEVHQRFITVFKRALPDVPPANVNFMFHLILRIIAYALACINADNCLLGDVRLAGQTPEEVEDLFVNFAAAGICS